MKRYYNSKYWYYEKEEFPDDEPLYYLYYNNDLIGAYPSWNSMRDTIKEAKNGVDKEERIRLAKEFLDKF